MTDEEINIAIAEACGWKFPKIKRYICGETFKVVRPDGTSFDLWRGEVYCTNTSRSGVDFNEFPFRSIAEICSHAGFPDYLNDLNAMQEAEKMLTEGSWKEVIHATNKYTNELCKVIGCLDTALFQFAHATSAQRAEAFLRTLNLWVE